ncbi:MAG: glucosaminidase domain-containing protein [Bacteroidota bacterium]|nr:glucosaminidase domain-containing protein [Bacteroidota bacterium]
MSKEVEDFIKKNANDVIKSVKGTGVFPSVKMAQMIIESSGKDEKGKFGIGKGLAVRKANNYFGIKADKAWKGNKVQLATPRDGKPVSYFRVYPTALDSLKDHTTFLLKNSRYTTYGVFTSKNPEQQTQALQKSGYSESPTYGKALIGLINAYKLTDLDKVSGTASQSFAPWYLTGGLIVLASTAYAFRKQIKEQFEARQAA